MKDRQREILYLGCGAVFVISLAAAYVLPFGNVFGRVVMVPAFGSLIFGVWRLLKDKFARKQSIKLHGKEHNSPSGVVSPIVGAAYDKHAAFCEEYIQRVQHGFQEIVRVGITEEAMSVGEDLMAIRLKHAPYLTSDIRSKLEIFEAALLKVKANKNMPFRLLVEEERNKAVKETFRFFGLVAEKGNLSNDTEVNATKDEIVGHVRNTLGMSILAALRQKSSEFVFKK